MTTGQQQSVSTLRFMVYDRPLHPELFVIYHDHRIVKSAYEARIWITGCTHVISFYREKLSLVELMADARAELPRRGRLLELPIRGERDHDCRREGGINYMASFQVERMSPQVYARTHRELTLAGARRGLFVPFPARAARSLPPFTYIDYDAKPNELHVFAYHAFPEDLTVIRTQSIFELG
ncbi:MAG: DUF2617 family protein [Phycisphaerae bacterium]